MFSLKIVSGRGEGRAPGPGDVVVKRDCFFSLSIRKYKKKDRTREVRKNNKSLNGEKQGVNGDEKGLCVG